eukprot:TRINITY_DN10376_c1_g1_i2.p1 TRINITY_DN10376_c1_g1~~TRINITY_DN10376_c1_g1_i2.p1  ORF type:complete len:193 (+),score=48.49 TRINITY_DN10376_c1_g1_i2:151-729(+)
MKPNCLCLSVKGSVIFLRAKDKDDLAAWMKMLDSAIAGTLTKDTKVKEFKENTSSDSDHRKKVVQLIPDTKKPLENKLVSKLNLHSKAKSVSSNIIIGNSGARKASLESDVSRQFISSGTPPTSPKRTPRATKPKKLQKKKSTTTISSSTISAKRLSAEEEKSLPSEEDLSSSMSDVSEEEWSEDSSAKKEK